MEKILLILILGFFAPVPNTTKADSIVELRDKAEQGDSRAQVYLGAAYYDGKGVVLDFEEAAKWFQKAAEQGDANAQECLGVMYHDGNGVPPDFEESVKWFRKAADQGNSDAQWRLGIAYYKGNGVSKDFEEAVKWFRKAAEQGNADAQWRLGIAYYKGNGVPRDFEEAVKWLRKAAEQGSADAQWRLGNAYYLGEGVSKDFEESVKWFRKAAERGSAEAQSYLGLVYHNGEGVPKDFEEAVKWLRKAAEQGDAGAQSHLGVAYHDGEGVPKDFEEAVKWLRKAAEHGNTLAQACLSRSYFNGERVSKDNVEALAWINLAAASGEKKWIKIRDILEKAIGTAASLEAQQRSKEILNQMEKKKQEETGRSISSGDKSEADIPKASGSGVFVSADGLLATAAHVVQGAGRIAVMTSRGSKEAELVQMDTVNDVAVLKCEGTFVPAPIGPSKKIKPGQTVFTLGFPNKELQGFSPKMTRGEISSLSGIKDDPRQWQISVPVQSGNSGGGLFDENGNLVGLVVSKLDAVEMIKATGDFPENVNYAVKSAYLMPVLENCPGTLPPANSVPPESGKLEDVVGQCEKSAALILVY